MYTARVIKGCVSYHSIFKKTKKHSKTLTLSNYSRCWMIFLREQKTSIVTTINALPGLPARTQSGWFNVFRNRISIMPNKMTKQICYQLIMTQRLSLMMIILKYQCQKYFRMKQTFQSQFRKKWLSSLKGWCVKIFWWSQNFRKLWKFCSTINKFQNLE